jgi:hypothetical protein
MCARLLGKPQRDTEDVTEAHRGTSEYLCEVLRVPLWLEQRASMDWRVTRSGVNAAR